MWSECKKRFIIHRARVMEAAAAASSPSKSFADQVADALARDGDYEPPEASNHSERVMLSIVDQLLKGDVPSGEEAKAAADELQEAIDKIQPPEHDLRGVVEREREERRRYTEELEAQGLCPACNLPTTMSAPQKGAPPS